MDNSDLLITAAQSADGLISASVWEYYDTLKLIRSYKNGGITSPRCLEIIGKDYLLCAQISTRFLNLWLLNNEDVLEDLRLKLPRPANCLTVCPEYNYLVVGISCKFYVWHLPTGKLLAKQKRHSRQVAVVKFSVDGLFLLVGGEDGMLITYCIHDLVVMQVTLEEQINHVVTPMYIKNDHSLEIQDIYTGILGTTTRFATVSADRSCRIYKLVSGELICNLVCEEPLCSVVYSSFHNSLFVGMNNGNIKQFTVHQEAPPKTICERTGVVFQGHTDKVICLALNISETILATGSLDCHVFTWNIQDKRILKKIRHGGPITNLTFKLSFSNFFANKVQPKMKIKSLHTKFNDAKLDMSKSQPNELGDSSSSKSESQIPVAKEDIALRLLNQEILDTLVYIHMSMNTPGTSNQ